MTYKLAVLEIFRFCCISITRWRYSLHIESTDSTIYYYVLLLRFKVHVCPTHTGVHARSEENGITNEALILHLIGSSFDRLKDFSCKKAMGCCTAQCKMLLFSAKTVMKESCSFELVRLKEKNKKKKIKKNKGKQSGNFLV